MDTPIIIGITTINMVLYMTAIGAFDWLGMILVCFVLPVLLSWAIGKFMRKKGWIKEGDLKVDLG